MTLLVPGVAALALGAIYLTATHLAGNSVLTVASNDPAFADDVRQQLITKTEHGTTIVNVVAPATGDDIQRLIQQVSDKSIDGYIYLQTQPGVTPKVTYASRTSADLMGLGRIQDAVENGLLRERLRMHGIDKEDTDMMLQHLNVETVQIKNGQPIASNSTQSFFAAYAMMFLLYFSVTYYAMNTARSVVQEKTSRIFEVMLATVRPEETMAGKILGVGCSGLLQIAIWCLTLVPLRLYMMAGSSAFHVSISLAQVLFFAVYFVLGFLLYSSLAAALGASVSAEQEVQQFAFPLVLPMFVAFVTYFYILSAPNSAYAITVSMFPFTAPIAMLLRISSQMPPFWQIGLSIATMLVTIWLVVKLAGRIYRVGILMYGKRATLPEIVRWIRMAE